MTKKRCIAEEKRQPINTREKPNSLRCLHAAAHNLDALLYHVTYNKHKCVKM